MAAVHYSQRGGTAQLREGDAANDADVTEPFAIAVTNPEPVTVAVLRLDDVQVKLVPGIVSPSASVAVATS